MKSNNCKPMPKFFQAPKDKVNKVEDIVTVIENVIANHGEQVATNQVCHWVRHLAAVSLTYPNDRKLEREFYNWLAAAKIAFEDDEAPKTFEQRVVSIDAIRTRALGVRLD